MHTPNHSTYSFEELTAVMTHPAMGSLTLTGAGLGTITFSRANDVSAQDLASDGSVMTSKIQARNGLVTIVLQQSSDGARWLRKLNQYLETAPASEWTQATCIGTMRATGARHTCIGLSPQKTPDGNYAAAGQQDSFAYMAQQIKIIPVFNNFLPLMMEARSGSATADSILANITKYISMNTIAETLDKVSSNDLEFITNTSLQHVYEPLRVGETQVMNSDGTYGVMDVESDILLVLRLVCEAIMWGVGDFFDAERLGSIMSPLSSSLSQSQQT